MKATTGPPTEWESQEKQGCLQKYCNCGVANSQQHSSGTPATAEKIGTVGRTSNSRDSNNNDSISRDANFLENLRKNTSKRQKICEKDTKRVKSAFFI
jgi:hypothetical protein